jgi:hypothetical protein
MPQKQVSGTIFRSFKALTNSSNLALLFHILWGGAPVWNLDTEIAVQTEVFLRFPQFLQANIGRVPSFPTFIKT